MGQSSRAAVHEAIGQLGRLSELFQKRRAQLAATAGLTEHQWGVLEEVSTEHFMPSMFARQRDSSPAAVSKTIRQLVDRGLVTVSLQAGDARQRKYELTVSGQAVMAQLRASRQQAISLVWEQLPQTELEAFTRFGRDLADRLERLLLASEALPPSASAQAGEIRETDFGNGADESSISAE